MLIQFIFLQFTYSILGVTSSCSNDGPAPSPHGCHKPSDSVLWEPIPFFLQCLSRFCSGAWLSWSFCSGVCPVRSKYAQWDWNRDFLKAKAVGWHYGDSGDSLLLWQCGKSNAWISIQKGQYTWVQDLMNVETLAVRVPCTIWRGFWHQRCFLPRSWHCHLHVCPSH